MNNSRKLETPRFKTMLAKKLFLLVPVIVVGGIALLMANRKPLGKTETLRFYYDLTFKANLSSDSLVNVMTILDVNNGRQSLYRDYTMVQQDSILREQMETMKKTGVFVQMEKLIKMPVFGYRVSKRYPITKENNVEFIEGIEKKLFSYREKVSFSWTIEDETDSVLKYPAQRATMEFGGRKWIAWFATAIPIQDGPYKFCGLPGLIVRIHDAENEYRWNLTGIENLSDYSPATYADQLYYGNDLVPKTIAKARFVKAINKYKLDPFASLRGQLGKDQLAQKIPGTNLTQKEMIDSQEKMLKGYFTYNNNPIERE